MIVLGLQEGLETEFIQMLIDYEMVRYRCEQSNRSKRECYIMITQYGKHHKSLRIDFF